VGPPSSRRTPLRLCVLLSHLCEVQGRVQVTVLNMPHSGCSQVKTRSARRSLGPAPNVPTNLLNLLIGYPISRLESRVQLLGP